MQRLHMSAAATTCSWLKSLHHTVGYHLTLVNLRVNILPYHVSRMVYDIELQHRKLSTCMLSSTIDLLTLKYLQTAFMHAAI